MDKLILHVEILPRIKEVMTDANTSYEAKEPAMFEQPSCSLYRTFHYYV